MQSGRSCVMSDDGRNTTRRENKAVRAARELRDAVAKAMDDMPQPTPKEEFERLLDLAMDGDREALMELKAASERYAAWARESAARLRAGILAEGDQLRAQLADAVEKLRAREAEEESAA